MNITNIEIVSELTLVGSAVVDSPDLNGIPLMILRLIYNKKRKAGAKKALLNNAFQIFFAYVTTGVDINGDQSLGLINHNVSSGLQPDFSFQ